MIYWLQLLFPPLPNLKEMKQEVLALDNLQELDAVYFHCWEEFVSRADVWLKADWREIAETINEISSVAGRDIPLIITTASMEEWNPIPFDKNDPFYRNIKFVYLPTFLFFRTQYRLGPGIDPKDPLYNYHIKQNYQHNLDVTGLDIADSQTGLDASNFKFPFIYMTLYPKYHRCRVMDLLAKHNLIERGAVSWREYDRTLDRSTIKPGVLDSQHDINASPFPWKWWTPKRLFLDQAFDDPGPIIWDWLPKEYSQSFMSIIGESLDSWPGASEKTATPLMFNKPFLIAGGAHSHRHLEDMGFKLYDEIFDYSFDKISELDKRMEALVDQVVELDKKIQEHGYQALLDKIKDKLVFNKIRAHEITVDPNWIPKEVVDFFNNTHVTYSKIEKRYQNPRNHFPYFEYAKQFNSAILKK
jgi:hypothetical protein